MKNQIKALKVKIKSLAEEARIIRAEELKAVRRKSPDVQLHDSLRHHRVWDVRREQRSAMLAYAMLRGKEYRKVECERKKNESGYTLNQPDYNRVRQLVEKFGGMPYRPIKVEPNVVLDWVLGRCSDERFVRVKSAGPVAA